MGNFIYMRPCCKCGGAGVVFGLYAERKALFYGHCTKCGFDGADGKTLDEAKRLWNERKDETTVTAAETAKTASADTEVKDIMTDEVEKQNNEANALLNTLLNMNI